MSVNELKEEIKKVIDRASEPVLEEILEYLKEMINQPRESIQTSRNLKKILQQDKNLLQRLAE